MSRCFPFPPPNYRKDRDLRLTESIKESLSKEKRKDKKRERKEKKNKSKDVSSVNSKHGEHSRKKQKLNDNDTSTIHLDSKAQFKKKMPLTKDECNNNATELIKNKLQTKDERSGITEERTLRVFTPEPCESSESTENSSRAGRNLEANNTNHCNSIFPFKLPSQKQNGRKPAVSADFPCTSSPKIIESTQANEVPCSTGPKPTKVQKKSSASEATYFAGRTTPEPRVLKASPALPSNGAPSFSAQRAPKPKSTSAFPTREAARYSGHAIRKPKVEAPCFSGHAPPKPTVLKSSPATAAAKLSDRSLPEPKAPPAPSFSGRVTPKPEVLKAPPASKADLKPEGLKALPASKANCFSDHNLPKPKVVATPVNEAPSFSVRSAPMVSKASLSNGTPGFSDQTSKALVATPLNEAPCTSGHATKAHVTKLESCERKSKRSKKHREDPQRKVKELILSWKPEPLIVHVEEDSEWMFSKSTKQSKVKSDVQSLMQRAVLGAKLKN